MDTHIIEISPDLGEILFSEGQPMVSSDPATFTIQTIDVATWAARKVLSAQARILDRKVLATEYKKRIDAWLERASKEDEDSVGFLSGHLRVFTEQQVSVQRKSRSVALPGATLSLRKKPDRIEVLDEAELLAYCEASYPEAIVLTKSLSKTALKAMIKTGELPSSIELVPGEDEFYIRSDDDNPQAIGEHNRDAA
ncbi:MAG: hypothetical protein CVU43_16420 [Chloroflexi bacterium HGW-Chloroflexi-5]|jgi:hypothetical protein|nr:MAG: hypothetical protein CVV47_15025 [Spirochaetae bacterium HGW-Spirochaetae-3]PKN98232.1 MAG: hypothetical protein CVU43_16420 [Chloroflexi bacterium HGW-Chloroflexi-5]